MHYTQLSALQSVMLSTFHYPRVSQVTWYNADRTRSYSASQDEYGRRSLPQPHISPARHSCYTEEPQIGRSCGSQHDASTSAPQDSLHNSSAPHVATLQLRRGGSQRDVADRYDADQSSQAWPGPSGILQRPPWMHRWTAGSRQRARQTLPCSMRGFAGSAGAEQQSAAAPAEPAFTPPGRAQNPPAAPWTPTQELRKRNFLPRRMGHLMQVRGWPSCGPSSPFAWAPAAPDGAWQRSMTPCV